MAAQCSFYPTSSIGKNLFDGKPTMSDKPYMDSDTLNKLIALNLASLIEEKGLNASRLAKDAGLSHTGVRDILQSKVRNPTYRTLVNIAEAAGVDVRRITVGPDFDAEDAERSAILDLIFQLEPAERQFLINAAKAQIAARNSQ